MKREDGVRGREVEVRGREWFGEISRYTLAEGSSQKFESGDGRG